MTGLLDGRTGLISGGARGMGASEARIFADEGGSIVIGDVLDEEGAALANEIGDRAVFVHLDVTSEADWEGAVALAADRFGPLDVLVNNAGIVKFGPIVGCSLDDYMDVINVNQVGVFLGMRAAIRAMAPQRRGSIVNISSVEGLSASPWVVSYVASKFAVRGMTKVAALEFGPLGVRVNSIHPGGIDTPMLHPGGIDLTEYFADVPLGRIGQPDEVARLALWLASDESSYCTGSEFTIDGGMTAGLGAVPEQLKST